MFKIVGKVYKMYQPFSNQTFAAKTADGILPICPSLDPPNKKTSFSGGFFIANKPIGIQDLAIIFSPVPVRSETYWPALAY